MRLFSYTGKDRYRKVTSADDGSGMPGVNVVLKGAKTGTVTNADGLYSIKVPSSGGTLVFSFIGFTTREVRIGDKQVVNVQMHPDVTELEEVIVSGYGQIRRDPVSPGQTSNDFRWSASVAAFGMLLRESPHIEDFSYRQVATLAQGSKAEDREGYRSEFINLVKTHGLVSLH